MKLIDLADGTPKNHRIYLVCIKQVFYSNTRDAYADWTDNGFILTESILFNDEYIFGFYSE
ncbi:hypothetical protein ACFQ1R_13665 [Mariniflexile jejuense]|uniref:Uncharacterized protein n=1 Tax=Mariniflexile jejuense TaxID=1173582 RepID=A0ABW3JLW0_9FLAO